MRSPYAELLLRPDHGYKAYRLRCRFVISAFPPKEFLDKAKVKAAERFVDDMAKQGYEYLDAHGVTMTGPFPETKIGSEPKRRPHLVAKDAAAAVRAGQRFLPEPLDGLADVPPLAESERWEYELAAVFVRKTIVFEYAHPEDLKN